MPHPKFKRGDQVEVLNSTDDSPRLYYPATVLRSPVKNKNKIFVEYRTLLSPESGRVRPKPLKEHVALANVRPVPPSDLNLFFKVGDTVDAYCIKGWRRGTIMDIYENSAYLVLFDDEGEEIEFDRCNLRVHREWNEDSWVPPLPEEQKNSREMTVETPELKLKTSGKKTVGAKFRKGMEVEVSDDQEGYKGSWWPATIVSSIGRDKFLVEYKTLTTDDGARPLREEACVRNIRPPPPPASSVARFRKRQKVDAWYNDGWWEGVVLKMTRASEYIVYFSTSNEVLKFEHSSLRLHQDWIEGEWVISKDEPAVRGMRSMDLKLKTEDSANKEEEGMKIQDEAAEHVPMPRNGRVRKESVNKDKGEFGKGMKIEVRTDEEGFRGSWYTATIVDILRNKKFLVRYETLKTDDETDFLKEEVDASNVRPCPDVQHVRRFKMLEIVDAWHNDGWWEGCISKVLAGSKYTVHFSNSNELLDFRHSELRPHLEWIDGKWEANSGK